jgi:hypothetical protein
MGILVEEILEHGKLDVCESLSGPTGDGEERGRVEHDG